MEKTKYGPGKKVLKKIPKEGSTGKKVFWKIREGSKKEIGFRASRMNESIWVLLNTILKNISIKIEKICSIWIRVKEIKDEIIVNESTGVRAKEKLKDIELERIKSAMNKMKNKIKFVKRNYERKSNIKDCFWNQKLFLWAKYEICTYKFQI